MRSIFIQKMMMNSSAIFKSPIGLLQITATDSHICSVVFRNDDADLITSTHHLIAICLIQLKEYFAGQRKVFELPLEPFGTIFQQSVWATLQTITYGQTNSYLTVAKQIGNAKSIRAVGAANGKNPIAVIIPCHRVIGENQKLIGYSGGLWRKQWLLNHEAKYGQGVMKLFE